MKICYIAPFGLITKGTTAARLLPIADQMAARGHAVRVVVPPWDDPASSPDLSLNRARLEKRGQLELFYVPVKYRPQPLTIPARLAQAAREFEPDIIHVFKPKAFSGLAALLLSKLHRPFILDTDDWEGRGGYNDVSPYSWPQKTLFNWQESDLPRRAVGVTVASRTLQTQAWSLGVKPENILYLPNGIAPEKFAQWHTPEVERQVQEYRAKFGFTAENLVLLAYTRFVEFQPARLLDILEQVLKLLPAAKAEKVKLLIVGGGFYNEEKDFLALAETRGLAKYITLTGRVTPAEVPALLQCGDVALYPFDDNLINRARSSAKFLDLIMAQRPLVTEAVGELREYLAEGPGAKLVKPGDSGAFAQAVADFAVSPPDATARANAAHRLQAEFSWAQLTAPLEDFYKNRLAFKCR